MAGGKRVPGHLRWLRLRAGVRRGAQVSREQALPGRARHDEHDPLVFGPERPGTASLLLTAGRAWPRHPHALIGPAEVTQVSVHCGCGGVAVAALDGLEDRAMVAIDSLREPGAESLPGEVGLQDGKNRLRSDSQQSVVGAVEDRCVEFLVMQKLLLHWQSGRLYDRAAQPLEVRVGATKRALARREDLQQSP